jgi:hypothetical protein
MKPVHGEHIVSGGGRMLRLVLKTDTHPLRSMGLRCQGVGIVLIAESCEIRRTAN